MNKSVDLPSFDNPPVHEVAFTVQFKQLAGLKSVHVGQFWQTIREDFPGVDDLPPFAPLEQSAPEIEFLKIAPLRRTRMSSADATLSIQIQETRFITNWVKTSDEIVYPRFRTIYESFKTYFERFSAFLVHEGIDRPEPTHYELTYINDIGPANSSLVERLETLLGFCKWNHVARNFLPDPTVVNFAWQFNMPNDAGRLILNVNPAKRNDGTDVVIFVLKCIVSAQETSSLDAWFNSAHEAIVRSFAELTTPEAHRLWRSTNV